jgi:2-keto-4-pentenoate hydratase/2-oxohepta-3-ene-1,7-dioic acid hydratase in catechol pathway
MQLLTYLSATGPAIAARNDEAWFDLRSADASLPPTLEEIFALGKAGWEQVAAALARATPLPQTPTVILPPILRPSKILCVGLNYADHARETDQEIPSEPLIFNKLPTAICGQAAEIVLPRCSQRVDYEAELVVVIGRGGRDISQSSALQHVAGYCCGNDVSARDWQKEKPGGQWLLGKSFDTFGPVGPHLVTADELTEPNNLEIVCRLNGKTMQRSHTGQLIFPIEYLISYVSQVCTLQPGDLLFTGTPPGVGVARNPPVFLKSGDRVEVEIEQIGVLGNPVRAID